MTRLGPVQAGMSGRRRACETKFNHDTILPGSLDLLGKNAVPTVGLNRSVGDIAGAITHPLIH